MDDDVSLIGLLRARVRQWLGLRDGDTPELWRLGVYDAQVMRADPNGKLLDVQPLDARLSPAQNVPLRVGVPGLIGVVQPGAVVRLGWIGGDASQPYCEPTWNDGATVTKLVLAATTVYLGAESGAQFVALANLVKAELDKIALAFSTFIPGTGGASFPDAYTTASAVAAAQTKAK